VLLLTLQYVTTLTLSCNITVLSTLTCSHTMAQDSQLCMLDLYSIQVRYVIRVKFKANISAVCLGLLFNFPTLCLSRENHMLSETEVFVQHNTERPNAANLVPTSLLPIVRHASRSKSMVSLYTQHKYP
jgi:hypothetical protein